MEDQNTFEFQKTKVERLSKRLNETTSSSEKDRLEHTIRKAKRRMARLKKSM